VKKTPPLYDALKIWLSQPDDWAHLGHLTNYVWMVVTLIQTGEVNLTQWLSYLPCRGCFGLPCYFYDTSDGGHGASEAVFKHMAELASGAAAIL
jgi:hypothetical protein